MVYLIADIYKFYVELNSYKRDETKDEVKELKRYKKEAINEASKYIKLLKLSYPDIEEKYNDLDVVPIPLVQGTLSLKNYNIEQFNKKYTEIVAYNKRIQQIDFEKIKLVNPQVFNFVIKKFNRDMIDEVLRGYTFNMKDIGTLRLINKTRGGINIDWEASNKLRKRLIDNGETPYRVLDRLEDGTIITNGGIKWLIPFNSPKHHWFQWRKDLAIMYKDEDFKLMKWYNLLLCSYKTGIVRRLAVLKKDKYAELKFEL